MTDIYAPCICGSGKKFKFCCRNGLRSDGQVPTHMDCTKLPFYESKVLGHWERAGLSPVHVVREIGKDSYALISYLVDFWCLGIKNTTIKIGISKAELKDMYNRSDSLEKLSYQDARSLILGARDFAQSIGIAPNPSFNSLCALFIEADAPYEKKFSFGCDGKPFYIAGPYDHEYYSQTKINNLIAKVDGNYALMM